MRDFTDDLIPIPASGTEGPPELSDEAYFIASMAIQAIDPSIARSFARKKYYIYAMILIFCFGLPLTIIGVVSIPNLPKWVTQAGVWISLAVFFIFFYAMVYVILSKHKVLKFIGFRAIGEADATKPDVLAIADRHGRSFEYGHTQKGNFWRYIKPLPEFRIEYRDGVFYGSAGLPSRVQHLLGQIPPHRRWKKLSIESGSGGIRTQRPVGKAGNMLYDIWLLEKILGALKVEQPP